MEETLREASYSMAGVDAALSVPCAFPQLNLMVGGGCSILLTSYGITPTFSAWL